MHEFLFLSHGSLLDVYCLRDVKLRAILRAPPVVSGPHSGLCANQFHGGAGDSLVRPNPFVLLARRVYRGPDSLRAIGQFFPAIAPAMLKFDLVADSEGMIPCRFLGVIWPFFVRLARRRREDRRPAELQEAFEPVEAFLVLSELFKFGHKKKGEPCAIANVPTASPPGRGKSWCSAA